MTYHLPTRTVVALIDARDWADACARHARIFAGWSMQRFYNERDEALAVVADYVAGEEARDLDGRLAAIAEEVGVTLTQVREVVAHAATYDARAEYPRWETRPRATPAHLRLLPPAHRRGRGLLGV